MSAKITITNATALLPADVISEVIDRMESEPDETKVSDAVILTDTLIGQNPSNSAHNPKVYYNALVAIFAAFPRSIGKQAVHKVDGLVANLKYQIKPSDLKSFLDEAKAERDLILFQAKAQRMEHERRAKLADDPVEQEFALRSKLTPDQRRERAKMILAGMKPPALKGENS